MNSSMVLDALRFYLVVFLDSCRPLGMVDRALNDLGEYFHIVF
jgi:hypothetical protein